MNQKPKFEVVIHVFGGVAYVAHNPSNIKIHISDMDDQYDKAEFRCCQCGLDVGVETAADCTCGAFRHRECVPKD